MPRWTWQAGNEKQWLPFSERIRINSACHSSYLEHIQTVIKTQTLEKKDDFKISKREGLYQFYSLTSFYFNDLIFQLGNVIQAWEAGRGSTWFLHIHGHMRVVMTKRWWCSDGKTLRETCSSTVRTQLTRQEEGDTVTFPQGLASGSFQRQWSGWQVPQPLSCSYCLF